MCVRRKNEKKNEIPPHPAAPKTHYEIHSSPATATTSRRRATKHVPRVSPCSPAFIDPGFVEIGHVQLSQSVKTTNNVTHSMHTDRQTGRQTNLIMPPCVHPGMKRLFCPIGKKTGLFTGHDPTLGSGQESFKMLRVGSGRVNNFLIIVGRVGPRGFQISRSSRVDS